MALLSKRDTGRPAAAVNAISHIVWGDDAAKHDDVDVKHTAVGAWLNAGAMLSWAVVGELLPRPRSLLGAARNGVLLSGLAYVTDYYVVPRRLNPGFEQRLSKQSLRRARRELRARRRTDASTRLSDGRQTRELGLAQLGLEALEERAQLLDRARARDGRDHGGLSAQPS